MQHGKHTKARTDHDGYLLIALVVLSALIPETGSFAAFVPIYCIFPPVLGAVIAAYWLATPLRRKVLLSAAAGCAGFLLRCFTTWFVIGFNEFSHFTTGDWVGCRAFFILLAFQILFSFLTLIPLHFVFSHMEKRKTNDA